MSKAKERVARRILTDECARRGWDFTRLRCWQRWTLLWAVSPALAVLHGVK